ncbi:AP2-like ethylene-responsive transcription factor BBM [Hondaea fermentalgiana]|uniref:AP2-like ethylene-responsive transcription factor BBM n=1 Tax=Hondaea fermentalgiana TaxID=2315210 RepID=A0A2R5GBY5_9STRA|nr:AP2-like ethylene-responsive transcription factor BBM [Hondaea fermentalgiana]|eukprot:GBG27849.1 AP2-like ethylene-responsive transcription factor BBM [Hondaea fermentalgiana]
MSEGLASSGRKIRAGVPQSDFRGVSWDRSVNTWRCKVNSVHVGYFDSEVEAARAYDEATLSLHKPGCGMQLRLNFPFSDYKDKPPGSIKYETKRDGRARGSSKYRGVLWDKASKSWRAKIKHQGRTKYLGLYQDEAAAGRAYDTAALELRGTAAKLNFPDEHAIDTAATPEKLNVVAPAKGRPSSITVPENAPNTLGKRSPRVDLEGVAAKYARVMERHASRRESYQQVCQKLQFFDQRVAGAAASDDAKETLSSSLNEPGPPAAAMTGTEDEGLLNVDVLKLLIVNAVQVNNSKQTAKPGSRTVKKSVTRAERRRGRARNKSRKGKASGNNEGSGDDEAVADDDDEDEDEDENEDEDADGSDSSYKVDDDDVEEEEDEAEEENNGKNDGKVKRKKGKTARSSSSKEKVQLDLGAFLEDIQVKVEEEVRAFLEKNKIAFREKKKSTRRAGR